MGSSKVPSEAARMAAYANLLAQGLVEQHEDGKFYLTVKGINKMNKEMLELPTERYMLLFMYFNWLQRAIR